MSQYAETDIAHRKRQGGIPTGCADHETIDPTRFLTPINRPAILFTVSQNESRQADGSHSKGAEEVTTTAPTLHCYIREHVFMTPREAADIRRRFAAFAEREGYRLGRIYTERPDTVPAAFRALVIAAAEPDITAVVVPSLRHLAVVGEPNSIKDHLERVTGVQVLFAGNAP